MTPKFDYVVCSIEESHEMQKMSINEQQSSLLVHEQKLNHGTTDRNTLEEQALKASTFAESPSYIGRGRGKSSRKRGRGGRGTQDGGRQQPSCMNEDHYSSGLRGKVPVQHGGKSNIGCYRCHNYAHYSNECFT